MMDFKVKELGKALILGAGVVIATPFIAGLWSGVELMAFELWPGLITVGTVLAAGVSAFLVQLGIDRWMK